MSRVSEGLEEGGSRPICRFTSLAVFCGSSMGNRPEFKEAAVALGKELAMRNIRLVYGGGNVGLMGVIARTVRDLNGRNSVIGVIPKELSTVEVSGSIDVDTRVVEGMHERKALMAELSDGFICLPGGYGTLEEGLEMITWQQLGYHRKPVGVLNACGFYDKLLEHFDRSVAEGFVGPAYRDVVISSSDPGDLINQMLDYDPPMGHIEAASSGKFKHAVEDP